MRIAIDLTSLADNFSGIERYAQEIAKELINMDRKRKNTFVLLFKNKIAKEFINLVKQTNVECRIYKGKDKLFFGQIILPLHLYSIEADAFLFLAFPSPLGFHRKGIYNMIHDLTCWDCPETMRKKMVIFFKLSIRNAIYCSKGIIVNSQFTRRRVLEKFHSRKQIILAYCGISHVFMDYVKTLNEGAEEQIKQKSLDIRQKYHLPEQYLLCLATLEPRKNLPFLVEAYTELVEEGRAKIPLVLAGRNGWMMNEFLSEIEDNCRKNIIVTGFIDEPDLPHVYHMADCFIFPSIYEGFGMPPLEAITVGTMVISSDAASLPEVLGNMATYFKVGDKNDLKEKLFNGIGQRTDKVTVKEIKKRVNKYQWNESAEIIARSLKMSLED